MKKFKSNILYILAVIILGISIASTALVVYADTDGKELKITTQPEKLILNLGADFAGAEFELKFDSGVFPVPVRANSSGVLTMELGGSKTYTLTRIKPVSATEPVKPIPELNPTNINQSGSDIPESNSEITPSNENPITEAQDITVPTDNEIVSPDNSVPLLPMIIFLSLLLLISIVLLVMRAIKKRNEYYDDEEYDDEDDDDNQDTDEYDEEK